MAVINFGKTVSIKQAANIIMATPRNRYFLQGEPGIGKSAIMKIIGDALPDCALSYIDASTLDQGDTSMPAMDHENKVTRYYPNSRFRLHEGKRVVIMIDEFTKAAEPIKNMLHPLLEINNPRFGDIFIPRDSIIFLTGNLSSDAVGDSLKQHSRNRIVPLTVRKPDADEWIEWAVNNDIDPVLIAWTKQYPHALASYLDEGQAENPYIYQPRKQQNGFVSPRSLEIASNGLKSRDKKDTDSLICELTGTLGESASRDIQAYVEYQDQLPTMEAIVKDPKNVTVPTSAGACAVLVYGAVMRMDKNNIAPFMTYLGRFEPEWQAAFCITVSKNQAKQNIAYSSKAFADWVQRNEDLL